MERPVFSASVDDKLADKANTSAVITKTVLAGTEILPMLNKRITSTEKTKENNLAITPQDTLGGVTTDDWFDGFSGELDTITKQVKCTAAGALLIGTTNVMTSLNRKATTTQLSDYCTKTSIDTKLSKQVNYLYDIDSKLNTIGIKLKHLTASQV